jgi:tetratricopeptide (TPR) repeat protein
MDFPIFTAHYHCFGEYFLQTGEIELARKWAIQLHDYVASAPDNNHLAQAYGLLARIAFAAGDRNEARAHLSQALLLVGNADFPLAAWRVYYAAGEIFMKIGETGEAIKYQNRFVAVLRKLAQNFEPDDRLHSSLSNALAARTAHWGLVDDQPEVC